jgi:hypothetical protein
VDGRRRHVDLASLRTTSTAWELEVSSAVEKNPELAKTIRDLEKAYDNELLDHEEPGLPSW